MKKWFGKILPSFLICAAGVTAILIGIAYFHFIFRKIYEDSTDHLREIYGQVNRSFSSFVERNWGLLEGWEDCFALAGGAESGEAADFIAEEKEIWGFSEFYFLSEGKTCRTLDGAETDMELGWAWDGLFREKEPVMAGETLPTGQEITVFAVPVEHGEYEGFGFDAIAVSYTNEDLASSLNVSAFDGEAMSFVIHNDGIVLLSTQTGGSVFQNYLVYLRAASDLDEDALARIQDDWTGGSPGLLQCQIGGIDHCILYQPVGYRDYMLLSAVPQSAVSAGFLSVQKITINVLISIFLLVGVTVTAILLVRNSRQSRKTGWSCSTGRACSTCCPTAWTIFLSC